LRNEGSEEFLQRRGRAFRLAGKGVHAPILPSGQTAAHPHGRVGTDAAVTQLGERPANRAEDRSAGLYADET
ncbi:MAG: hypothetical protein M3072_09090, partial [Candidatus Dormibacteraeota bacterium]|nr:hypothetical protein [Candidatus Dormibacteraeota bacterium]